eukprot:TRINITY_DN35714_c0_g1_i1.p1 TRINITY_DN35714_c0_g1~~TRINITY_DN35714_c0_g1_i1.p1  ORF type:complete len:473 (-),score=19.37 TRINITY_DN35714_c0_g1_i1:50-1468(-)
MENGSSKPNTASGFGKHTERYRICMVSDFFCPGFGGVEIHIYNMAQRLIARGHKAIVVSRMYDDDRVGVRYMPNGLKVYYLPFYSISVPAGIVTLPTMYGAFPIFRNILIRERIQIVHGHQTTSGLCHQCISHAKTMGLKTVFTDHSLFGLADAPSIHINKVLEFTLSDIDHVICVSHTSKENTILRARVNPSKCSTIPNATDTTAFTPSARVKYRSWGFVENITIVVMTRLVYRKGVDLLVEVVPEICKLNPTVKFLIGGDGPRRVQVEEMIERNQLFDRVTMLGEVPHAKVGSVLSQGQIFLNCSLTEAFCIAIIEAVSTGLLAVSTAVGGVPEVLPNDMLILAEPEPDALVRATQQAIQRVRTVQPWEFHNRVRSMYSWDDVAERTETVYHTMMQTPSPKFSDRIVSCWNMGNDKMLGFSVYATICCVIRALEWLVWVLLEWFWPEKNIEVTLDFPMHSYKLLKDSCQP